MIGFLLFIHVVICILLVMVILLQSSKGSGLAGAFGGGGGAGAVFGGRGAATFLSKVTTVLAILFMLSNIGHSMISKRSSAPKSLIQQEATKGRGISPASALPAIPGAVPQTPEVQPGEIQTTQPEASSTVPKQDESQVKDNPVSNNKSSEKKPK